MDYQYKRRVSFDESMVPYFRKHGAKQYIQGKPLKLGFKLWVTATPPVVANLISILPVMQTDLLLSHCHGQLFYKLNFPEALERSGSYCNRNGESKLNSKCSILRYRKKEQREAWISRYSYWCVVELHRSTLER